MNDYKDEDKDGLLFASMIYDRNSTCEFQFISFGYFHHHHHLLWMNGQNISMFFFFDRIIGQTFTSKNHNSWSNNWQDLPVCLFVCRVKLIDLHIHWNSMIDRSRNTMYQLYEFWAANINYERLSFVKKI